MIKQSIKMSISAIMSNKLRSFLTMLGIIIGVLTVCLVSTIFAAVSNIVIKEFGTVIEDYCQVNFNERMEFSQSDIGQMKKELLAIDEACGYGFSISAISTGNDTDYKDLAFVSDESFQRIVDLRLECGRFFIPEEIDGGAAVCILSYKTAVDLFQSATNAIGKQVSIEGITGKVVGVMKKPSVSILDYGSIIVPQSFYSNIYPDLAESIQSILIKTNSAMDLSECTSTIESYLNERYNHNENLFTTITLEQFLSLYNMISIALEILLLSSSLLTMIISGTGIMNIMIVSVTNRTREIGIRKSIGATGAQIQFQFLVEAILLCVIGAVIGITLSFVVTPLLESVVTSVFVPVEFSISASAVALAAGFSILIGVIFGYYPAKKAANLKPVEALRYEG